jgi:hypothetical protein
MKLEHSMSGRKDFRSYALLFIGLAFAWAGATIDPAKNCDEGGSECAPWMVPVAFCVGVLGAGSGIAMLIRNKKWGCRVDLVQRRLLWWNTNVSPETHSISLDEVSLIKVRLVSDGSDTIFFYDRNGDLISIPKEEIFPHKYEAWVRRIAGNFPHIAVEVAHD